jgi:hypothetical protein
MELQFCHIKLWEILIFVQDKMNIIDYILKEARIHKWSVLQDNQIKNMTDQFLAKNKVNKNITYVFDKKVSNWDEAKAEYYKKAEFLNNEIIKKLNLQPSEEKSLLVWLLQQIYDDHIHREQLNEDKQIIKDNLELYFKNKKEIHKDIYNSNYSQLKQFIVPYREAGQESKHQEFLSKPIAQGKEYKIYKVTDIDTCVKIGQNTSWCIQGKETAEHYLSKGPLYLVTKNDHRFALLSFESAQFMDVNDNELNVQTVKDIFSIWPESQKLLEEATKENAYIVKYMENPSEELQLDLARRFPQVIGYLKNPSEKVKMQAVSEDIQLVEDYPELYENANEELQLEIVKIDPLFISYLKNPTEKVQMIAVKKDIDSFENIRNPAKSVIEYVEKNK